MRAGKIVDRYLLRRQIVTLLAVATLVVSISLIVLIVQDIDDLLRQQATWGQAISYFVMRVPHLFVQYMPVAVFIATLVNLGVLMRRREISAMMSAGISHLRIAAPLLLFSVALAVGVFAWNETLALHADEKAEQISSTTGQNANAHVSELQFVRGTKNRLYALSFVHRSRLHNFVMLEMRNIDFRAPRVVLFARSAAWNHHHWNFTDGVLYRYDDAGHMVDSQPFGDTPIRYPIEETPDDFMRYQQTPSNMTLSQLLAFMRVLRSAHEDTSDLWPQVHNRFAYPLSALVMTLLACAVVLHSWEEQRTLRIVVAIAAAPGYLALANVCLSRAPFGPHLSAWVPDLFFGLLGAVLLWRSSSY